MKRDTKWLCGNGSNGIYEKVLEIATQKERKIIHLICMNGCKSYADVGRKLGVSREAVRRSILRLRKRVMENLIIV